MSHIQLEHRSCPSTVTSALELHSSSGCIFKGKEGRMNTNKFAQFVLLGAMVVTLAQAQVKHIEMRVEGMT
jgi:hypothetical protein